MDQEQVRSWIVTPGQGAERRRQRHQRMSSTTPAAPPVVENPEIDSEESMDVSENASVLTEIPPPDQAELETELFMTHSSRSIHLVFYLLLV